MPTPRNGSPNDRAPASPLLSRNVEAVALISQNTLTRQSDGRAHLDLQVNLLAEQESTKTVALLERIAQELDISLPSESGERELAAPTDIREVVSTLERASRRFVWGRSPDSGMEYRR
jgi:uncharacterized membrane protein